MKQRYCGTLPPIGHKFEAQATVCNSAPSCSDPDSFEAAPATASAPQFLLDVRSAATDVAGRLKADHARFALRLNTTAFGKAHDAVVFARFASSAAPSSRVP